MSVPWDFTLKKEIAGNFSKLQESKLESGVIACICEQERELCFKRDRDGWMDKLHISKSVLTYKIGNKIFCVCLRRPEDKRQSFNVIPLEPEPWLDCVH